MSSVAITLLTVLTSLNTVVGDLNFVSISDIHLNNEQVNIMEMAPSGYNKHNDMDMQTFTDLSNSIKENVGDGKLVSSPTFVLYLGDIVGHQHSDETDLSLIHI